MITVRLHTIFQKQTPEGLISRLTVEMPNGSSLRDLLSRLQIQIDPEALLLVVNGRNKNEEYLLCEGDEVDLMAAMSGGN